MRGEYHFDRIRFFVRQGSPPHARGILLTVIDEQGQEGITPACAGNTCVAQSMN